MLLNIRYKISVENCKYISEIIWKQANNYCRMQMIYQNMKN